MNEPRDFTVRKQPAESQLDETDRIMRVFVCATQPLDPETRRSVVPRNTTMHDGRGDFYVYKYNREGRIVASMFPMGRRGAPDEVVFGNGTARLDLEVVMGSATVRRSES